MKTLRPESALELREWVESSTDRFSDEGVPAVTGAALDRPPSGLGTLPRLVVSTSHLSEVIDFQPRDLTITVGAGMRLSVLARVVEEAGLWLPLASVPEDRSVGGWVASAPVSGFDGSFGPVRRHVLACTLLLWDGRSTRWGRPVMKNVAGYEIPKLICGSRARLGIVTTVTLRLWPRPRMLRHYHLAGASLCEVDTMLTGAPRFEAVSWKGRVGGAESATASVSLAGGPRSVSTRTELLQAWARDRGIDIQEEGLESTGSGATDATRPPRPGTSAAYRITFGRRYLTAGLKDLDHRLVNEVDPWSVEAFPATGVVRLLTQRQKAAGQRHAPAWLTTLADAVGRASVPPPTLETPAVRIERGGEAEHAAARRMRSTGSRDIESRWLAAFAGVEFPWQADYL
ncbi:MAG: FAD-binding oxidoreductase [Gemmatimonadetes bacterium]|nr:FAD-binding oxidoreductase [Gemmatimonadota bacterium]MCK5483330.1 FAD-binding oxidoreductase [Gemmatimonadota bacterium]